MKEAFMAITFELNAEIRHDSGKGASRRLRRDNKVPAIIYGAEKNPVAITLDHHKIIKALENEAFYSHILTIHINKEKELVVLKDLQRDPSRPYILHIDFLRIQADHKITMHIPLHFTNENTCPGVKAGGTVSHSIADVEVICLPKDLPEFITVDLAKVELESVIHLSDLKLPKGVQLTALSHGHDVPVVSIHKPRSAETSSATDITA